MSNKLLNSWENEVSRQVVDEIGRSVIGMDVEGVMISDELEERVSLLIAEGKHIKHKRLISKRIAVILIAAILAILTTFSVAANLNVNSDKYIIKYYDEYFTLRTRPPKNFSVMKDEDFVKRVPTFIPEEYELQEDNSAGALIDIVFTNPTNNYCISYQQYQTSRVTFHINAEKGNVISLKINGHDGIAVLTNVNGIDHTGLYWSDGTYDYGIFATLNLEETLAIAKSIEDVE